MKKSHRYMTSLLMTTIYLLIVFTPLAPLAMQSKIIAHAVTGECSGDCRVDGCSLERSAAHSCCCWQKKQHTDDDHVHSDADVCRIPPAPAAVTPNKRASCCDAPAPAQGSQEKHTETTAASTSEPDTSKPVTIGSTPCGGGKLFTLLSIKTTQHLPYIFYGNISSPAQSHLIVISPDRLTSRYVDPPDPPPIISSAS